MAIQIANIKKINNFRALMGNNTYTYDDIMKMIENYNDMPSWHILRKYNVIKVIKIEHFTYEVDDTGDVMWNGYYEWNPISEKWIIDHEIAIFGLV